MDSIVKLLLATMGAKPNGTPKTFTVEGTVLLRNLFLIIGVTAGAALYTSRLTSAPDRLDCLEKRMSAVELSTTRTEEGVRRIDEKLTMVLPFLRSSAR